VAPLGVPIVAVLGNHQPIVGPQVLARMTDRARHQAAALDA
jgi:hypothetical protein